jgi:hypothetical protein
LLHPALSAAAWITACRGFFTYSGRKATGSAPAACAISSMERLAGEVRLRLERIAQVPGPER